MRRKATAPPKPLPTHTETVSTTPRRKTNAPTQFKSQTSASSLGFTTNQSSLPPTDQTIPFSTNQSAINFQSRQTHAQNQQSSPMQQKALKKKVLDHSKTDGILKIKRTNSVKAFFDASYERYHMFCAGGRIFCRFEDKPTSYSQKPEWAIFTRNIDSIEENYEGKETHFFIHYEASKDLHMKTDSLAETKKFVGALNFFRNYYKALPPEPYEFSIKGKEITPHCLIIIMKELESTFNTDYSKRFDYTHILNTKKIKKYYDRVGAATLKNRAIHSMIKKCSAEQVDEDFFDESDKSLNLIRIDNKVLIPKASSLSKNLFATLVTRKDTDYTDADDEILGTKDLPLWMEPETMYIFSWDDNADDSVYNLKISTVSMLQIEYLSDEVLHNGYSFRVETKSKVYFFECPSATICGDWVDLLRKSKKTGEELTRTKFNMLKRNVDPMIHRFHLEVLDIESEVDKAIDGKIPDFGHFQKDLDVFSQCYDSALDELDFNCDALQAARPFINELFKSYLHTYHTKLIMFASNFYNSHLEKFGGVEILKFIQLMLKHDEIIRNYGLSDPRLEESWNELTGAYAVKTFKVMMAMVLNVVENARTEYNVDASGKITS